MSKKRTKRKPKKPSRAEILAVYEMFDADMLQGNINRMMVTKDQAELARMFWFAMKRLNKIYDERIRELSKDKEKT